MNQAKRFGILYCLSLLTLGSWQSAAVAQLDPAVLLDPTTVNTNQAKQFVRWTLDSCVQDDRQHSWCPTCPDLTGSSQSEAWGLGPLGGGDSGCSTCGPNQPVPSNFGNWPLASSGQGAGAAPTLSQAFTKGSLIDNSLMNYIHWADDIPKSQTSPLSLRRFHHSRRLDLPGTFGPGVFSNFDIKLFIYSFESDTVVTANKGQHPFAAQLIDPAVVNAVRLHSRNFSESQNDPNGASGYPVEFDSEHSTRIKSIAVLDSAYAPVNHAQDPYVVAKYAKLISWSGEAFLFELSTGVNAWYGGTDSSSSGMTGKLVKITDSQDRSVAIEYGTNGAISKVVDPAGQEIVFAYGSSQVAGGWAASSVTDASGSVTNYTYTNFGLSSISHADGTASSSFSQAFDATTRLTVLTFNDATASPGHESVDVHVSPLVVPHIGTGITTKDLVAIQPSTSGGVRMVTSGGEVTYLAFAITGQTHVYEGGGRLKVLAEGGAGTAFPGMQMHYANYYNDGWSLTIPTQLAWYDYGRGDDNVPSGSEAVDGDADGDTRGYNNGFYDCFMGLDESNASYVNGVYSFDFDPVNSTGEYMYGDQSHGGFGEAYMGSYSDGFAQGGTQGYDYRPTIVINGTLNSQYDALIADAAQLKAGRPRFVLSADGTKQEYEYDSNNRVSRIIYDDNTFEAFCYARIIHQGCVGR